MSGDFWHLWVKLLLFELNPFIASFGIGSNNVITFFSNLSSLNFWYSSSPKTKQFASNTNNSLSSFSPETMFLVIATDMSNGFPLSLMWLMIFSTAALSLSVVNFKKLSWREYWFPVSSLQIFVSASLKRNFSCLMMFHLHTTCFRLVNMITLEGPFTGLLYYLSSAWSIGIPIPFLGAW